MRTRALSIIVLLALAFGPVSEALADTTYGGGLRQLMAAGVIQANATTLNMGNGLTVAQNGSDPSRYDITSAGGGGGYATIQSGGAGVTARTIFNLASPSMTAVDNAGATRTDISIATSPASAATVVGTGRVLTCAAGPLSGCGDLSADRTLTVATAPAAAATVVGTGRALTCGNALTGCGDLSADRTLAVTTVPASQTPVGATRTLTCGNALTGCGDLSADRTLAVTTSPATQTPVGTGRQILTSGAAMSGGGDLSADRTMTLSESPNSSSVVGTGRVLTCGNALTGCGDLSADRTLAVTTSPATQTPVGVTRTLTGGVGIQTIGDLSADRTVTVDQTFAPTWTGAHTFNAATPSLTSGNAMRFTSISMPAYPGSTDLYLANVSMGGDQIPVFKNANEMLAGGEFCPHGAVRFGFIPLRGNGTISGAVIPNGMAYGTQQFVVTGGSCTFPVISGSTFQTRAPQADCSSGTSVNNYGDIFTGSAATTGIGNVTMGDGFKWTTTISDTTNLTGQDDFVGFGSIGGVNDPNVREGVMFCYRPGSATGSNWTFCTNDANSSTNFAAVDLGANFIRNTTNVYQFTIYVPPGGASVSYRACNVTTMSAGGTYNCTSGTVSTHIPAASDALVKENYCQITSGSTACTHVVYNETGCYGVGMQ